MTVLGLVSSAQAVFPGENGRIAFVSRVPGTRGIATMRPDGSDIRWLLRETGYIRGLDWSANGQWLLYDRFTSRHCTEIWKIPASGQRETQLTNNDACDLHPSWAPNGDRFVFASDRRGTNPVVLKGRQHDYNLYTMRSNGTGLTRLTSARSRESCPAWSPDGRRIAFSVGGGNNADIAVMRANGTHRHLLTRAAGADYCPQWSPDGRWLVFTSARNRKDGARHNWEVYSMRADGSQETRLSNNAGEDYASTWSPDGTTILFEHPPVSRADLHLFAMDPDGSNERQITFEPGEALGAAWRTRG